MVDILQSRYCYVSGTAAGCKNTDKQVFIAYDKPGGLYAGDKRKIREKCSNKGINRWLELYNRSCNKEENKPNEDELQQTVEIID